MERKIKATHAFLDVGLQDFTCRGRGVGVYSGNIGGAENRMEAIDII